MLKSPTVLGLAVAATAASLGACHPARIGGGVNRADRTAHVGMSLNCPPQQGDLVRGVAGTSAGECRYTAPDGRRVVLRLMPLHGRDASQALKDVETSLRGDMAHEAPSKITPAAAAGEDERVVLNLPGVHIETDASGAHVHALGENIDAKSGGEATIGGSWNGVSNTIHAGRDNLELRVGFAGRRSVDLTFILQSDHPGPSGERLVGYVARGPAEGPLVVATVQASLADSHRRDVDLKDLKALVALNVS